MTLAERRLRRFANRLGLHVRVVAGHNDWQWNPKRREIRTDTHRNHAIRVVSNLAHELGHWLIATPKERRMPEFGLGDSPEAGFKTIRLNQMSVGVSRSEVEQLASLAGMLVEMSVGADPMAFTWDEHSWGQESNAIVWQIVGLLVHLDSLGVINTIRRHAPRIRTETASV